MTQKFTNLFFCLIIVTTFFASPLTATAKESEAVIQEKLHKVGEKLVQAAAKNVIPHKTKKSVKQDSKSFVASYVEIDIMSLRTELRPSEMKGRYVGLIKYHEHHYQCRGNSKQEALSADCIRSRSRKLTEIISYDGKWRY